MFTNILVELIGYIEFSTIFIFDLIRLTIGKYRERRYMLTNFTSTIFQIIVFVIDLDIFRINDDSSFFVLIPKLDVIKLYSEKLIESFAESNGLDQRFQ